MIVCGGPDLDAAHWDQWYAEVGVHFFLPVLCCTLPLPCDNLGPPMLQDGVLTPFGSSSWVVGLMQIAFGHC